MKRTRKGNSPGTARNNAAEPARAPLPEPAPDQLGVDAELNWRIVELLQEDGRMPFSTIAEKTGVSEGTIRNRVNQLRADNVMAVTASVSPEAFGYRWNSTCFLKVNAAANLDKRSDKRFNSHSRANEYALAQVGTWSFKEGKGALRSMVAIERYSRSSSACPAKRPAARRFSSDPYLTSNPAAVFGPTPLAPGIRSDASPLSAMKSGTCAGSTPYRSRTSAGPILAISPALIGCRMVVLVDAR